MTIFSSLARIHWPHLLLIPGLATWVAATRGLDSDHRIGGWLTIAFVVLMAAERMRPFRLDWRPGARALRRDGSVLGLNVVVDTIVSAGLAGAAISAFPSTTQLALCAQFVVGLALGELVSYTLHRASHCEGWLWRVHLLHHRPTQLNAANAFTAHPLNALYDKVGRLAPSVLLGFSDEAILVISLFALTQSLVAHANIAGTIGRLEYLVGSAELHRLHHSTREKEAVNFGTVVPWWDLALGTYHRVGSPERVGVFDDSRYPSEFSVWRLLTWPFAGRPGGRRAQAGPSMPKASPMSRSDE